MTTLKLKTSFPVVWGDLAFQNQWLRKITMLSLALAVPSVCLSLMLMAKKPHIIVMDTQAKIVRQENAASPEAEAVMAAKRYLELRYTWQPTNQAAQLSLAKNFIASQSIKAFEKTAADLVAFSKGKNVAQRVYPLSVNADTKDGRIQIVADRFTEIQALKAATALKVTLVYQTGTRTLDNPWGVYVVREEEAQ